jgi:GNAT superfamily N-acetyltransferase
VSQRVEPLSDGHDLDLFHCGHHDLDAWLQRHARHAVRQGTRTYVLVDQDSRAVLGYFAVAPHLVQRGDAPRRVARGAPARIPAILLAKSALDERRHGQVLGGELLIHALRTIVDVARSAGGRLIVVDAIDDAAASFYRAHDFEPTPNNPHRLVMKFSTAAHALGVPWP